MKNYEESGSGCAFGIFLIAFFILMHVIFG